VTTPPSRATIERGARYRPELQGLRALAAALVVVYHVWTDRVSGGVDVFFVVSGFLLTGTLVRAADRGLLSLRALWARITIRLLPTALTVLLATAAAALVVLPEGRWLQTVREVAASALFVQNWQLAADAVDYTARGNTTSVVQHFWSLSIQGQVYLTLPMLVMLVAMIGNRPGAALRDHLAVALLGVAAASFSYSVALTTTNQPLAYFHTLTRLWEFAVGGLLVLCIERIRLPRPTRVALGWTGVVGLLLCGLVLNVATLFPGYAALWPTACAVLVLLTGTSGSRWGVDRLLATRAARYLGDLSYALYLWHWPLLVLVLAGSQRTSVDLGGGALIVVASLAVAAITHHLVERPAMRRAGPRLRRTLAAGTALMVLSAAGWQAAALAAPADATIETHPGALALAGAETLPATALPPLLTVSEDWVRIERWDCRPMARFPMDVCAQPVDHEPARRIVVVGDSHTQQLIGALAPVVENHGGQVIAIVRGACPFSTASEVVPDDPECLAWLDAAGAEITDLHPDLVVTLASREVRPGRTEHTPPGFVEQRWRLHDIGIPVLAVRDNPRFDHSQPDCLAQHGRSAPECGIARAAVYASEPPWTELPVPPTVTFLDLADQLCDAEQCPAEIGNVVVYMDDNHLTATYTRTMASAVDAYLEPILTGGAQ
jgi:peptidoglycan/LPS O-acetylase OafA/YrhL